ncbi:MAG: Gfo/Idh/MocA family oxidoreductase [Acidobacteriota bacterium]
MVTIVVEGIGDIVSKPTGYGRALEKLKTIDRANDLEVVFTDVCESWYGSDDPDLARVRQETRKKLEAWGARFIDKSASNSTDWKLYKELLHQEVDAVFVATPDRHHIQIAKHWLTGNCKRIFIEKPLTNDPKEAHQWMKELETEPHDRERLIQLDHYLPKMHAEIRYENRVRQMLANIGRLKGVRFYMLEDHSGTDDDYRKEMVRNGRTDRNGPIENEGRLDALQSGVSLDLLPHLLAILYHFGDLRTIEVDELRAARYQGVDYTEDKLAGIKGETFAAAKFRFTDHHHREIPAEAYVGKGIRGSRKYPSMRGNVKILELEGAWRKIEFDFNSNIESLVGDDVQPMMDLEPDPYYYLLRDVAFERLNRGTDLGMPIRTGALILDKIVSEISSRTNREVLPTYKLGDKYGGLPPELEDLLEGGSQEIQPL